MALSSAKTDTRSSGSSLAAKSWTLDQIIDAAIDHAPEAISRRVVLQAIDWKRVEPQRVASMLADLARPMQVVPRGLVNTLLLAGHVLPVDVMQTSEQRVLNALNERASKARTGAALDLPSMAGTETVEPEMARAIVGRLAHLGSSEEACRLALDLWARVPQAVGPIRGALAAHLDRLPSLRLRLASFSTTDPLAADLALAFGKVGHRAQVTQSPFGNVLATLLQPDADADAHVVLLDLEGFAGVDWRIAAPKAWDLLVDRADSLFKALSAFGRRTSALLLINTVPVPSAPTAGILDGRHASGLRRAADLVNQRLQDVAEGHGNILVVDADRALADIPSSRHHDPKLWFYGRIAFSPDATRALACAFAETWSVAVRGPAKVLALDLDNTLWGGVYGDDGLERLVCSTDFPGNAYQAFQQECLRLKGQGVLLVALSKNNPDAISVFDQHHGMVLKADDFAATAINWLPKPDNIRRLAHELNLGLDSFVFIDDSPHEREAMRRLVPEVIVPEMPGDPAQRPSWLRRLTCTWPLRLTEEDERRSEMYAAERGARALKAATASFEDYLAGLEQRLTVSVVGAKEVARVAQMHQRTNQFNLTTRRLTEGDIAACVEHPERGLVLVGHVADRFGDHGIVAAATVSIDGARAEIETLLMSCRVIGREIERAFLAALLTLLDRRGVERVTGRFIPTAKNGMVRDFYSSNGFMPLEVEDDASSWVYDLRAQKPAGSPFVSVAMEA